MRYTISRILFPMLFCAMCSSSFGGGYVKFGLKYNKRKNTLQEAAGANLKIATDSTFDTQVGRDPDLYAITELTAAVPPEFGAYFLAEVVESGRLTDSDTKLKLLRNALDLATLAHEPIKRKELNGSLRDTRSGFRAIAFSLNLDRTSLQSRIIDDILSLRPKEARELFQEIQFPRLAPVSCDSPLVYDPSPFYQTLDRIIRGSFTAQEKSEARDVEFLEGYERNVESHSQVIPIVNLLATLDLSSAKLQEASGILASSLEQLRGDERSFADSVSGGVGYGSSGSMMNLTKAMETKKLPTSYLLNSFRSYLISNFGQTVCPDASVGDDTRLPATIQYFNRELRRTSQVPSIDRNDLKELKLGKPAIVIPLWQSSGSKALLVALKRLRFGHAETPLSLEQRMEFSWGSEFDDFLIQLEDWKKGDETDPDYFHERCVLYEGIFDVAPDDRKRARVLDSFVRFMAINSFQAASPIEWFSRAWSLMARTREPIPRRQVIDAYRNSSSQTLRLYGLTESWTSTSPGHSESVSIEMYQ